MITALDKYRSAVIQNKESEAFDMFTNYPDVITIDQLCKMLGIGRAKAYKLLNSNVIKAKRIGKKFLIPKKAVIEFVEAEKLYIRSPYIK